MKLQGSLDMFVHRGGNIHLNFSICTRIRIPWCCNNGKSAEVGSGSQCFYMQRELMHRQLNDGPSLVPTSIWLRENITWKFGFGQQNNVLKNDNIITSVLWGAVLRYKEDKLATCGKKKYRTDPMFMFMGLYPKAAQKVCSRPGNARFNFI